MNGIVVEINQNDAVILSDDGLFTIVGNDQYEIGQSITIKQVKKITSKLIAGAAGAAAVFAFCTIGAFAYYTPTDYVSMDVNPSVEYSVNRFERILDAEAVNDDGKEILSGLKLNNLTIEAALKATLDQMIADGYITDDPDGKVVIATSNDEPEKAKQLAAELEQEVQTYLKDRKDVAADVEAEAVKPEKVQEAKELGVTPGKLNLVEKLESSTKGAINKEEWLNMPVKEINEAIKENHRSERDKAGKENDREDRSKWNHSTKPGADWNENTGIKPDQSRWDGKDAAQDRKRGNNNSWHQDRNKDTEERHDRDNDWRNREQEEFDDGDKDHNDRHEDEDRSDRDNRNENRKGHTSHN